MCQRSFFCVERSSFFRGGDSQFSRFDVERIFGVNLVEASAGVEEDLPDVIDVPLPLVAEASLDVHLVRGQINERMEDVVIEDQTLEDVKENTMKP